MDRWLSNSVRPAQQGEECHVCGDSGVCAAALLTCKYRSRLNRHREVQIRCLNPGSSRDWHCGLQETHRSRRRAPAAGAAAPAGSAPPRPAPLPACSSAPASHSARATPAIGRTWTCFRVAFHGVPPPPAPSAGVLVSTSVDSVALCVAPKNISIMRCCGQNHRGEDAVDSACTCVRHLNCKREW